MDPRIAPPPYPTERFGGKLDQFEVGSHGPVVKRVILANVTGNTSCPDTGATGVWMSIPDGRLLAVLTICYEPADGTELGDLTVSRLHLAATEDMESSCAPVEDLLGTAAGPVAVVESGLRGRVYSPTEEVEGMEATFPLLVGPASWTSGIGRGRWVAKARWQALRPMSEIDWRLALSKMALVLRKPTLTLNDYVPG